MPIAALVITLKDILPGDVLEFEKDPRAYLMQLVHEQGIDNLLAEESVGEVRLDLNVPVARQFPDQKIVRPLPAGDSPLWTEEADLPDEPFDAEGRSYRERATIKITGFFPKGDLKGLSGKMGLAQLLFGPTNPIGHFKAMCRNHHRAFPLGAIEEVKVEGFQRKEVDASKPCREVRVTLDVTEHPDCPRPWEVMTRKEYEHALEEGGMLNHKAGEKLLSVRVDGNLIIEPTDGLAAPATVQ